MRLGTALIFIAASLPFGLANPTSKGEKDCKLNEFWYSQKGCCLPTGGPPSPPSPPSGSDCPPTGYYWGKEQGCCVPRNPPPLESPPPQCRNGWSWFSSLHKCCQNPTPPSVPPSHPSSGSGHSGSGTNGGGGYGNGGGNGHGSVSTPGGDNSGHDLGGYGDSSGHGGDNGNGGGKGGGGGHGSGYHKRHVAKVRMTLCPNNLDTACPIKGSITGDYECIDTNTELESCGGCVSSGKGQDCTSIKGAWNVGCEQGHCIVYSCALGFQISVDGASCVPL